MNKMTKTQFISSLMILTFFTCFAATAGEGSPASGAINARDLLIAYQQDPTKAVPTYEGETVLVTGVIVYTGPDIHSLPSIELSDKAGGESQVLCVFNSPAPLTTMTQGEEVTISGKFHIVGSGMVVLKQSEIL